MLGRNEKDCSTLAANSKIFFKANNDLQRFNLLSADSSEDTILGLLETPDI
jgi:hypothetical protein